MNDPHNQSGNPRAELPENERWVDGAPPLTRSSTAPSRALLIAAAAGLSALVVSAGLVWTATTNAKARLAEEITAGEKSAVAVASQSELAYCTPAFKQVLERVLHSCGLDAQNSRRGCQPADVKTLASISDEDFNALFTPLKDRGAVLLFDNAIDELDAGAMSLLEERFSDRRGARYFFVVARASKRGNEEKNRALSHRRANSVKFHLEGKYADPELDKQVGQLWLGSEFAQLDQTFCTWKNSRTDGKCGPEEINRSVFVSWVDCRL